MGTTVSNLEATEYRVVLVQPESRSVLALASAKPYRLPRVRISSMSRPAQQLQKAINAIWGVSAFILDARVATHDGSSCVLAELLSSAISSDLEEVALDRIMSSELTSEERHEYEVLLESESATSVARIGWIDEAVGWVASATGRRFSTRNEIEQLNAGGGFALLRLRSDDGRDYWLKATGAPNTHELSITACLSDLYPEFLPKLVATKKEWRAWLTEGAGGPLPDLPSNAVLVRAAMRFASLQVQTIDAVDVLLAAGAFDQRIPVLRQQLDGVIAFLIDAMERQTSMKIAPLGRRRIEELGKILHDALYELEGRRIPDALVHNDLNLGNVLYDGKQYAFTDWSEAAVGNPFLSLERFRLLSSHGEGELPRVYGEVWRDYLSQTNIDCACRLAPLLSIFAYLYGRGDWLKAPGEVTPQFQSYARSLARHMDRAAQDRALLEVLCR